MSRARRHPPVEQIKLYQGGVGTEEPVASSIVAAGLGRGMRQKVRALYDFLALNWQAGDEVRRPAFQLCQYLRFTRHSTTDLPVWLLARRIHSSASMFASCTRFLCSTAAAGQPDLLLPDHRMLSASSRLNPTWNCSPSYSKLLMPIPEKATTTTRRPRRG